MKPNYNDVPLEQVPSAVLAPLCRELGAAVRDLDLGFQCLLAIHLAAIPFVRNRQVKDRLIELTEGLTPPSTRPFVECLADLPGVPCLRPDWPPAVLECFNACR